MLAAAMAAVALAGSGTDTDRGGQTAAPLPIAAPIAAPSAAPGERVPFYFPLFGGVEFAVAIDRDLVANVNEHEVEVLAIHDRVVTLIDSYRTRAATGDACGAANGRERYVRVLDVDAGAERFARLIESCRHAMTVDEPPITWAPGNTGFTINYRSEPPRWVPVAPAAGAVPPAATAG